MSDLKTNSQGAEKRNDRMIEIIRLLQTDEQIPLDTLACNLDISGSTLRRDLREFEKMGYVTITSGKVSLASRPGDEMPFSLRELNNQDEKHRIAQAALGLIQNGETVFISGGTTTLELARMLPGQRRVTVITNSLRVVNLLVDQWGIDLVILGGKVRPDEQTLHGHLTEYGAQQLRADKFFYGIQAISPLHGLTHGQIVEVSTDRALADAATQVIVLVDHTKFGKVAPALVLPLNKVNIVITGKELAPEYLEGLQLQNVRMILA
jgi:DeoR family transcriptional regulator, aga operon transcriptional repressor